MICKSSFTLASIPKKNSLAGLFFINKMVKDIVEHRELMDKVSSYTDFLDYDKNRIHLGYDNKSLSKIELPNKYELLKNFPNPFSSGTSIKFSLPAESFVKLEIFDEKDNLIRTILNNINTVAGWHIVYFDSTTIPNGTYFCKINANNFKSTIEIKIAK